MTPGRVIRVLIACNVALILILVINVSAKSRLMDERAEVQRMRETVAKLTARVDKMQSSMRTSEEMDYLRWKAMMLELLPKFQKIKK